jgi:hypothetical protein
VQRSSGSSFFLCTLLGCVRDPVYLSSNAEEHVRRPLHSPYTVVLRRNAAATPVAPRPLAAFPPPEHDALGTSYYVDAQHSVINPDLKKQNEQAQAGMKALGRALAALSDGYLRSPEPDLAAATLDGMYRWASADALLGVVNRQETYNLTWSLAAYALDCLSAARMVLRLFTLPRPAR